MRGAVLCGEPEAAQKEREKDMPELFEYVAGCIRSEVWPKNLIALHNVSDGLIAMAYTAIPISLLTLRKKRDDIPVDWIAVCFAAFILLCGTTHVLGVVTVWAPIYWFDGVVKAATAAVSLTTAWLLQFRVMPLLLAIPSKKDRDNAQAVLQAALDGEKAAREEAENALADAARALAQLESRDATIRELMTPILPLPNRALLVPLIGALDSARAALLTSALLKATQDRGAKCVVLDLTGVPIVDTQVADVLLQCAHALTLLGAKAVITGIRADVACTIVHLGVDLSGITTLATLPDGIRLVTKDDR